MRIITALVLLALSAAAAADPVRVNSLRMWPAPDNTRLVFDVGGPVEHTLFTLSQPERIVIDIKNAQLVKALPQLDYSKSFIQRVRHAQRDKNDLRVVLDLRGKVRPKSFVLKPNREYGHRLVIDLYDADVQPTPRVARSVDVAPDGPRDVVVAIDAGHGGEDPGAIGRRGTREKDVVLAVAKRLQRLVESEPGMRAVMIRDGDYYVDLKKRVALARDKRADLFVSIHADAFHDRRARGSSVYTLSTSGATSEAASWLADKENAADLIGGVSLDDKDDLVAAVLLDLSQSASLEASHEVATHVLSGLKSVSRLHKPRVERAGFRVLKAPDVPSILVETAFISNPSEESKLVTARYQQTLAQAMMNGVRTYFRANPPPDSLLAMRERRHVISHGETLSGIARSYRVSMDRLREANGLTGDMLRVGEVLRIPHGS